MIKVSFQRHGSIVLDEIVFQTRTDVNFWLAVNEDNLSICKVQEVFH